MTDAPVHGLLDELVALGRVLLELLLGDLRHALADPRLRLVEHVLRDVDERDGVTCLSSDLPKTSNISLEQKPVSDIALTCAIPAPMRPPPMTTNSLMGAEALAEVDRPRARVLVTVLARNDILDGWRSLSGYLGLCWIRSFITWPTQTPGR